MIEVLVALAILAITLLLAYRATAALTEGEAHLSAEALRWRTLDAAFERFEADVRQAMPRAVRDGERKAQAWIGAFDPVRGSSLVLSRAGPEFSPDPGVAGQRIGYRQAGTRLEVLYWPALDNPADARPLAYTLLDGIAQFRVEYLLASGAWTDRWPLYGEGEVPRAIRLRLLLASGEAIERWFALR